MLASAVEGWGGVLLCVRLHAMMAGRILRPQLFVTELLLVGLVQVAPFEQR